LVSFTAPPTQCVPDAQNSPSQPFATAPVDFTSLSTVSPLLYVVGLNRNFCTRRLAWSETNSALDATSTAGDVA